MIATDRIKNLDKTENRWKRYKRSGGERQEGGRNEMGKCRLQRPKAKTKS